MSSTCHTLIFVMSNRFLIFVLNYILLRAIKDNMNTLNISMLQVFLLAYRRSSSFLSFEAENLTIVCYLSVISGCVDHERRRWTFAQ